MSNSLAPCIALEHIDHCSFVTSWHRAINPELRLFAIEARNQNFANPTDRPSIIHSMLGNTLLLGNLFRRQTH